MIVAGDRQHAAMGRGPRGITVLQHVGRAIDAGTLAVPDGEDAIDGRAWVDIDLLAAPDRGRCQILVDAGLEMNTMLFQVAPRLPQRVVVDAQRRAAIPRDESAGIESGGDVALALHHRQANQRLYPREIDAAGLLGIFVVERYRGERHARLPPFLLGRA